MSKHNFIIMATNDFSQYSFADLYGRDDVRIIESIYQNAKTRLMKAFIRINFSKKVNSFFKTPFSFFVNKKLFDLSFEKEKKLCFIFTGRDSNIYNTNYVNFLRRKYPDIKLVLYMQDLVSRNPHLNIEKAKKEFDIVISYDKGDSEKYGMYYYPTSFSNKKIVPAGEKFDVYFCGYAKQAERYEVILKVFEKCKLMNLKCKFFITGLPSELRKEEEGVWYDHNLSYMENLAYAANSKCILEVMQANADGYTPRLWESIVLDKHLLTNNRSVKEYIHYSNDYVHLIDEDLSFLKTILEKKVCYPGHVKESLSAVNFLNFVEEKIG